MAALLRSLGDARRRGRVAAGSGAAAEQLHRVIGAFGLVLMLPQHEAPLGSGHGADSGVEAEGRM
jgi:hypothetical protein